MADLIQFDDISGARIGRVVREVENPVRRVRPLAFAPLLESGGAGLKLGTFTGNWQTGQYATVTLYGSTQTASVYNWCNPALGGSTSNTTESRYVIFGKVRGTHSAVELPMQELTRLGTISATWSKGSTATVTQLNGDGSATDETITFDAKNWFATVTVSSGTKKVACALVGSAWILIAAEC